jgi:hypothetical protein
MKCPHLVHSKLLLSPNLTFQMGGRHHSSIEKTLPYTTYETAASTIRQSWRHVELLISKIFLLVEQIRPRTSQIYNLRAAVAILLQTCTLEAVESITDALAAADDALVLVISIGTFVANAQERCRSHVRVADGAFAIAFVTQAADGDAGLLAAHDEIGVMARHGESN